MKFSKFKVIFILFGLHQCDVFASTIVVVQNQESIVSINDELGSILQLPSAVGTITSSKYFYITDIGSSIDPSSGTKTDVRTFQIQPSGNAQAESVTFVLADGKNIALKFIPTKQADKFYDIRLENIKPRSKSFLSHEMHMLKAMILDDASDYSRRFVDLDVKSDFKHLKFRLIRIYNSNEFTGYVFEVINTSSKKQSFDLSHMAFGFPKKSVMSHVDQESIAVCPLIGTSADCMTRMHFIVRGLPNATDDFQSSLSSIHSIPPFIKTDGG